jgi:hypothetical protein
MTTNESSFPHTPEFPGCGSIELAYICRNDLTDPEATFEQFEATEALSNEVVVRMLEGRDRFYLSSEVQTLRDTLRRGIDPRV